MGLYKEKHNRKIWLNKLIICLSIFFLSIFLFNYFYKSEGNTQLLIDIDVPISDKYQVFFDVGKGFNEEDSQSLLVEKKETSQTLSFSLPPNVRSLRIDLGTRANTIFLDKIVWKNSTRKHIWNTEDIIDDFNIRNNIDTLFIEKGKLKILSNGIDPYLVADNTLEISEYLGKDSLRLVLLDLLFLLIAVLIFLSIELSGFRTASKIKRIVLNYRALLISSCFLTIILAPMLSSPFRLSSTDSDAEKRNLARKPALNFRDYSYKTFIADYENYVKDNFGFREQLIRINNILKVKILNTSPSEKVILGKRGWLFYNSEGEIDDYRGTNHFTKIELEQIKSNLEERTNWLKKKGINYYITIAPNKSTIYSEYLPSNIKKYNKDSRLDQLVSYLLKNSDVHIIDLRPALLDYKDNYIIYKKYDTHWNSMGAFVGYSEIANLLKRDSVISKTLDLDSYDIVSEREGGDLANMLSMNDLLQENIITLKPKNETLVKRAEVDATLYPNPNLLVVNENNSISDGPKLLMYRDSFTSDMIPFLSEHFSRSVFIWDHNFNTSLIERESPDVVISEVVERNLQALLLANPEELKQ